ncbi:oxalate:formate antiporter-like isoform X1 [Branchiostoma floridae]|uniref:Oxalate:formate antiporter-like isoform X1 n=1 Tax=Branchiostoma floridae TaxID=7739 RepID=A0A9J7LE72_BRAFL|nr:oxalate:formate antiporter-like isoform X1 [Branchiostoma floridae]
MAVSMGKYRGWIAVLGGVLVHLTLGTIYTSANMNPYLTSYIRERSSPSDLTYKVSVWLFSLQIAGLGLSMFVGGYISRRIGPRWTPLLGGWLMSAGVALTYFTVRHSFYAILATYGLMFGLGIGIAYTAPLACAMKWMPERKGLVKGLVLAGLGGGSFIFDQVQTAYLNPNNLSPDVEDPEDPSSKYFDNKEILDKVPVCFLMLGGTYAAIQLLGALMIADPPEKLQADPEKVDPLVRSPSEGSLNFDAQEDSSVLNERLVPKPIERRSLSPGQMLKTREFYMLWFMYFLNGNAVTFISTLWKAFGQTKIQDDHFLALVGAFSAVLNSAGRPFWGWMADRYSFKVSLMGLCTSMIFFTMTLVAVPDETDAGVGSKVMFFIWVCGIFGSFCGNFSLFPTATAKTFGPDYVAVNYGLVCTCGVVSSITGGIITSALMSALGWFGMFSLVSGLTLISGIIAFFFKAKNAEGRDV